MTNSKGWSIQFSLAGVVLVVVLIVLIMTDRAGMREQKIRTLEQRVDNLDLDIQKLKSKEK